MNFSVKAPPEDPAVKSAREQQQKQADAQLTSGIQKDLQQRTRSRLRRFGFAGAQSPGIVAPGAAGNIGAMDLFRAPAGVLGSIGRGFV